MIEERRTPKREELERERAKKYSKRARKQIDVAEKMNRSKEVTEAASTTRKAPKEEERKLEN
jgi:hypothetical protein